MKVHTKTIKEQIKASVKEEIKKSYPPPPPPVPVSIAKNRKQYIYFHTKIGPTKVYTNIPDDGWCTPWAEELDTTNLYLALLEEEEFKTITKYAANLGAGITERADGATHIILPKEDMDWDLLQDIVILI